MWISGNRPGANHGEDRHRPAERLTEVRHFWRKRSRDRGDQRAGMPDADPEHEIGDIEELPSRPCDSAPQVPMPVDSPVSDGGHTQSASTDCRDEKSRLPPPASPGLRSIGRADFASHVSRRFVAGHQRRRGGEGALQPCSGPPSSPARFRTRRR